MNSLKLKQRTKIEETQERFFLVVQTYYSQRSLEKEYKSEGNFVMSFFGSWVSLSQHTVTHIYLDPHKDSISVWVNPDISRYLY